ncbi:MAG TPA: hypothetical protein VIH57_21955 [Bacteroidales bacterium]
MAKNSYLPVTDADRSAWLKNFSGKLPKYATPLGLTAAETTAVAADSLMFTFAIDQVDWFKKESAKRVAYKNLLAAGEPGKQLGDYPALGETITAPAAVPSGIFIRNSKLVQRIKNHQNYTAAIGEDLGIETHSSIISLINAKPELKVTTDAGRPVLKWTKGHSTAVDLYVDRGDGKGFAFLATATVPHYTDMCELPASVAQWHYKAIYKVGDEQTGEFSDIVSVMVSSQVGSVK